MDKSNPIDVHQLLTKAQVSLEPSARLIQDSRDVSQGDVFLAIKGVNGDGAGYIPQALNSGAACVLVDSDCTVPALTASQLKQVIVVDNLQQLIPNVCQQFYFAKQSLDMPLVAITGTNGKTSISHLLAQVHSLAKQQVCGVIGTMGNGDINDLQETKNTTPGITQTYQLVASFQQQGFTTAAMEVSSHALEQGRVAGLPFNVGVFTNLTQDHLDYHCTMENYYAAKAKLFTDYNLEYAVVNVDDDYGQRLTGDIPNSTTTIAYGMSERVKSFADYVYIDQFQCHPHGLSISIHWQFAGEKEQVDLQLPIYGEFNCLNLAAVFATGLALGWRVNASHFTRVKAVPGRLELFVKPNKPVCIVDYAHTPDALEQSLKAVKKHLQGKLLVIFGCGGDRDTGKRPMMAEIAERLADKIIVTNDNPRTESPMAIITDIQSGFSNPENHPVILDRTEAITQALSLAHETDTILIAGKGHETYQVVGNKTVNYDERAVVNQLLLKEKV